MRVVNTPFTILLSTAGDYFLFAGEDQWYGAPALGGTWAPTSSVPGAIASLAPAAGPDVLDGTNDDPGESGPAPAIFVATRPTELTLVAASVVTFAIASTSTPPPVIVTCAWGPT